MKPIRTYAVWYYDVIVRGPFAKKSLANTALKKIKKDCSCVYEKLKVGEWEPSRNAQLKHWTHPSVLLMAYGK